MTTQFQQCLETGKAKRTIKNTARARSLQKAAENAVQTAKAISPNKQTAKTIYRELYEALRECCEGMGYERGYVFYDHETITHFLEEELKEYAISKEFDRFRKIRNAINYHGDEISLETVNEAVERIPKIINHLRRKMASD